RLIRAFGVEVAYLASIGGEARWKRSRQVASTLLALAAETDDPYAGAYASFSVGAAAFFARGRREGRDRCDAPARRLRDECPGAAWEQATNLGFAHASLAYLGRTDELAARLPRALADADERHDVYGATTLRAGMNTLGLLAHGRPEEVRRLAD